MAAKLAAARADYHETQGRKQLELTEARGRKVHLMLGSEVVSPEWIADP
jgi:hypothetical protein